MIVDASAIKASVTPRDAALGRARTLHLSDSGGLTQFGVHDQTLEPGAASSERHWHDCEDEFVYVLEGSVTLHDDDGIHDLEPGDAVAWPHGDPNAHRLINRAPVAVRFLVVGSRVAHDVCTYPDSGRTQVNADTTWTIFGPDGSVLKEGDLPPALLHLRQVWGHPFDPARSAKRILRAGSVAPSSDSGSSPFADLGEYRAFPLSDAGGLSQFGAFTETLMPGARSSHRHWHSDEDEFLYVLDGIATLHENGGPTEIGPGICACWPAGVPNAHCIENRTDQPVTYFVVGSRLPEDDVIYPDVDLHYSRRGGFRAVTHKDGTPYPGWPRAVS